MKTTYFNLLFFVILTGNSVKGQEATKWRGQNQGIYDQTGLLTSWQADGPEILWSFEKLGIGYSSPAFAHDKIYVSGMEGSAGFIYCLSNEGSLIWKSTYGSEFDSSYPGSRATPVIAGNMVYMLSGTGDLACLNAENGRAVWKKNIIEEFEGRNIQWGINETVVISDDKLFCTPGGRTNNIVALNRMNGNLIWSSKARSEESAYCTPLLVKVGNRDLLVTHTANNVIGMDADSGDMLWSYPFTNRWAVHPNTPLFHNNQLFCFSGYGKGGVLLQLNADGSQVTKKWESEDLDSRTGGAVVLNGKIYGSGDDNRDWQCIDWETGKVEYKTREIGNGVIIAADGKLFLYSQRGELALVNPGVTSFEIVSKAKVTLGSGQHWAHPVIGQGRLLVRHGNTLIAYQILQ